MQLKNRTVLKRKANTLWRMVEDIGRLRNMDESLTPAAHYEVTEVLGALSHAARQLDQAVANVAANEGTNK